MKNKTKLITILFGALFALVFIGCTPTVDNSNNGVEIEPSAPDLDPPTSGSDLGDELSKVNWDLIQLGNEDVSGKGLTIQISENSISGSDGCNSYSGSFTLENNRIVFGGPFISTQMACEDMETPAKYLETLSAGGELSFEDNLLTIQTDKGDLVFEIAKAAELENTKWILGGLNNGNAVVNMAIDQDIYVLIEGDTFSGLAGCNNMGGGVLVKKDQIFFKDIFSTEMYCDDEGVMERESELLAGLSRVASFEIVRQSLTLFDVDDELVATFFSAEDLVELGGGMDNLDTNLDAIENKMWTLMHMIVGGDAIVPIPQGINITLEMSNGSVSGNSGCNMFNGAAVMQDGMLTLGPLVTTRRACSEEIMNFESAILAQFEQVGGFISNANGDSMTLTTVDGLPLAEFTTVETKTLYVGPEQVDCQGEAPQKCLLVKEDLNADYTYFYDSINGFEWEAGFDYELLVNIIAVNEPLADASSLVYNLVQIVSKTPIVE